MYSSKSAPTKEDMEGPPLEEDKIKQSEPKLVMQAETDHVDDGSSQEENKSPVAKDKKPLKTEQWVCPVNNSHKVHPRKAFRHIKNCPEIATY